MTYLRLSNQPELDSEKLRSLKEIEFLKNKELNSDSKQTNLTKLYQDMTYCVQNHGQEINKNFGKIVQYEIKDNNKKDTIVIDFKNKYING